MPEPCASSGRYPGWRKHHVSLQRQFLWFPGCLGETQPGSRAPICPPGLTGSQAQLARQTCLARSEHKSRGQEQRTACQTLGRGPWSSWRWDGAEFCPPDPGLTPTDPAPCSSPPRGLSLPAAPPAILHTATASSPPLLPRHPPLLSPPSAQHLPSPTFREHHKVGLGPLLPPPEFVLCAQELDAERGPFPQGLSAGALSHGVRPRPPAAGQGRAWAGQRLHPDLGRR